MTTNIFVNREQVFHILDEENANDESLWMTRTKAMISSVFEALSYVKHGEKSITTEDVRKYVQLHNIISFADGRTFKNIPDATREHVKAYLNSLPHFDDKKADLQDNLKGGFQEDMVKQHGFLEMTVVKALDKITA